MTVRPITTKEKFAEMESWLHSFDHKAVLQPAGAFHLFTKLDRVLAMTQQVAINTVFPAVNPKICTPRETTEISDCLHYWSANCPGGLHVAVPKNSHMHEHMAALGWKPKAVLYEPV